MFSTSRPSYLRWKANVNFVDDSILDRLHISTVMVSDILLTSGVIQPTVYWMVWPFLLCMDSFKIKHNILTQSSSRPRMMNLNNDILMLSLEVTRLDLETEPQNTTETFSTSESQGCFSVYTQCILGNACWPIVQVMWKTFGSTPLERMMTSVPKLVDLQIMSLKLGSKGNL